MRARSASGRTGIAPGAAPTGARTARAPSRSTRLRARAARRFQSRSSRRCARHRCARQSRPSLSPDASATGCPALRACRAPRRHGPGPDRWSRRRRGHRSQLDPTCRRRTSRRCRADRACPSRSVPAWRSRKAGSWQACARWSCRCHVLPSRSQKARPFLSSSIRPAVSGSCHLPMDTKWLGGSVLDVDRYGVMVFASRWTKSKIPWPPGSRPVMNEDQATGLCGGTDVPSGANPPRAATCAKCGSRPRAIRSRVRLKSSPSSPRTITRRPMARRCGPRIPAWRGGAAATRALTSDSALHRVIPGPPAAARPCRRAARCQTAGGPWARCR